MAEHGSPPTSVYQPVTHFPSRSLGVLLLHVLFLLYIGLRPVLKFYETHAILPRINFSVIVTACMTLIVLFFLCRPSAIHWNQSQVWSTFLITLVVGMQIVQYPWAIRYPRAGAVEFLYIIATTLVDSVMLWLVGMHIEPIVSQGSRPGALRRLTVFLYISFVATIILGIIMHPKQLSVSTFHIFLNGAQNYLMISDAYAVFTLLLIYTVPRRRRQQIAVALMAVPLLYATLSRTTLFVYGLAILPILVRSGRDLIILLLLIALVLTIVVSLLPDSLIEEFVRVRMLRLFFDPESDVSYQGRRALMRIGLDDLEANWFLGRFMAEVERDGSRGEYIHNWLSFWVSYGFIPFVISVILFAWGSFLLLLRWIGNPSDPLYGLMLSLSIFAILSVAISRSYTWPYPWLVLSGAPAVISRQGVVNR